MYLFADVINGDAVATKDMESQAIEGLFVLVRKNRLLLNDLLCLILLKKNIIINKYDMMDLQL